MYERCQNSLKSALTYRTPFSLVVAIVPIPRKDKQGPILPLGTDALALTPISPFRPRRWRGAILPASARVRIDVIDPYKRSVSATADAHEVRNVVRVDVHLDRDIALRLMFDPDHSLEERILNEQFL